MSAVMSPCGRYRYRLSRAWDDAIPPVLWIMLNPSTADAEVDDRTIRRCIAFSKAFGFGGMRVGNLYAFRSPDPATLWGMAANDARGPENTANVLNMAAQCSQIICAWGVHGGPGFPLYLESLKNRAPMCLGKTKHGAPRHPLYVAKSATLEPFA